MTEIQNGTDEGVLSVDPNSEGVYEIESLCMRCHNDGVTRILPIQIPHFKQILIESFSCEHCGEKNNSVKSAGAIQEKAVRYTFKLDTQDDFERNIVKSDHGVFRVEDLELEMPSSSGQFTNLESMFTKTMVDLQQDQPARKEQAPELYAALDEIIQRLTKMLDGTAFPITVTLEDLSGNSFIEPSPQDTGSKYVRHDYLRTREENEKIGLFTEEEADSEGGGMEGVNILDGEIYEIPDQCPACSKACTINMKKVKIPYFKDVIIMATVCENCGYRSSDIKTGGAIPDKGKRITLLVKSKEDLSRDILKSETCALHSKELGLEVQPGTLGGRFTTVEGLLVQVRDQLQGQVFDVGNEGLASGDSMTDDIKSTWTTFFAKLDSALKSDFVFSLTLEDPLANSFVQPAIDNDPQIIEEDYERTKDEMEDLGLNDMKTEDYADD